MSELPTAAVDRIIRKSGGQRVSKSAARELAEILEEKGMEIASDAVEFTEHAGRKTVWDKDIRLAADKK
ncbi:MAG: histone [Candidatus Hadarchaeia archaeon]